MKAPAFQFYTGDWRKDPKLSLCTPATRGVWIDLICAMHDLDRSGELRGTADQLARLARCSTEEMALALDDLRTTGAADVTDRNSVVTIRCRRMYNEANARKGAATRQKRRRGREAGDPARDCHGHVTEMSHPPSSSSTSPPCIPPPPGSGFLNFWQAYPAARRVRQDKCIAAWGRAIEEGADPSDVIVAAREYAESPVGQSQYCLASWRWLEDKCWLDDRAAWKLTGDAGRPAEPARYPGR